MLARIDRLVLAAFTVLACSAAAAQGPRWPTPQDIDRALKASPFPDAGRIGEQAVPQPPRLAPQREGIDIEALMRGLPARAGTPPAPGDGEAVLRIFVTLEMPQASLRLLIDQAARGGATLVLRGLKRQSMRQTLEAVNDLIGSRHVAWVIDPEAYTRFGVNKAPTFVLTLGEDAQAGCVGTCVTPQGFVSIAGDVSVDYALDAMVRRRPEAAPRAEPILKRLRGS